MTFNRLHAASTGVTVGKTFVSAVLRRHRYLLEVQRRTGKHRIPAAQPRNRTWGVDMTGKQDGEGQVHMLLGVVDHGSRRAPVEAWEGTDPYRTPPKEVIPFVAWDGRLRGYYLRR